MRIRLLLALLAILVASRVGHAQAVRAQPYSAQLKTDPAVGNIQGIQRYGRSLKTDPDEGEGFSYHVYPTTPASSLLLASTVPNPERTAPGPQTGERSSAVVDLEDKLRVLQETKRRMIASTPDADVRAVEEQIEQAKKDLEKARRPDHVSAQSESAPYSVPAASGIQVIADGNWTMSNPYPAPFDATAGIRNFDVVPGGPGGLYSNGFGAQALPGISARSKAYVPGAGNAVPTVKDIYAQPLIQVKMRVVEVGRNDNLQVGSVLDLVSYEPGGKTLIQGNNVNNNSANFSGGSRFAQDGLISFPKSNAAQGLYNLSPTGALINLTTDHLNWIAQFLATQYSADTITAPEVVTLNGQNVEFVAGQKVPFALGQTVVVGSSSNTQQVFYKNVGTFVSVTPRIVNWGYHGEGNGKAALASSQVADWYHLIQWYQQANLPPTSNPSSNLDLIPYRDPQSLIPFEIKSKILLALSQYSREEIMLAVNRFYERAQPPVAVFAENCECDHCNWKPEDCTIDLSVVVRLSDPKSTSDNNIVLNPTSQTTTVNMEGNVRAVANVIQVKSGNGVVMAGLIGDNEVEQVAKIPVLGDIPIAGFLFRSKSTQREKTEILIFLEARVLDPRPDANRLQSSEDYLLGQHYVHGEFLDNPLEYGMYRAGFGAYLPPNSRQEKIFWQRAGRGVRRAATEIDDMFK